MGPPKAAPTSSMWSDCLRPPSLHQVVSAVKAALLHLPPGGMAAPVGVGVLLFGCQASSKVLRKYS